MAKSRRDDQPGLLGEPPDDVRVTVTMRPAGEGSWLRESIAWMAVRARKPLPVAACMAILALAAAIALSNRGGTARAVRDQPLGINAAQLAAAYASAARCTSAMIPPHGSNSPGPRFDRAVWCARYAGRLSYRFIGGPLPAFGSARR